MIFEPAIVDGIPVNPVLPEAMFDKSKDKWPNHPWWGIPFVKAVQNYRQDEEGYAAWCKAWPGGIRYDTYCLDGGANNRPTGWGKFGTLQEAIQCAKEGPSWS